MNFGKKLHYLGVQQNTISTDNSVYYAVSFFDPVCNVPIQVNVMGHNTDTSICCTLLCQWRLCSGPVN